MVEVTRCGDGITGKSLSNDCFCGVKLVSCFLDRCLRFGVLDGVCRKSLRQIGVDPLLRGPLRSLLDLFAETGVPSW